MAEEKYILVREMSLYDMKNGGYISFPLGSEFNVNDFSEGLFMIEDNTPRAKAFNSCVIPKSYLSDKFSNPVFLIELLYDNGYQDSYHCNFDELCKMRYQFNKEVDNKTIGEVKVTGVLSDGSIKLVTSETRRLYTNINAGISSLFSMVEIDFSKCTKFTVFEIQGFGKLLNKGTIEAINKTGISQKLPKST
jgi:hypothetical protein